MPTAQEFAALQLALAQATLRSESLVDELRVVRTERDLLQEQLNKFKRQLFAAKTEKFGDVPGTDQKDMFFNEAEGLGAAANPAVEDSVGDKIIDVPGHKRAKRGRKPLDPALPREVVRSWRARTVPANRTWLEPRRARSGSSEIRQTRNRCSRLR